MFYIWDGRAADDPMVKSVDADWAHKLIAKKQLRTDLFHQEICNVTMDGTDEAENATSKIERR